MDFSFNGSITTMPDLSKVENLRELRLDNCENLTTVHESIGFLKQLVHLSASRCKNLENFLQRMFLPSLEVLKLDSCFKLEHLPDIVDKMNKPLMIRMSDTSMKTLPNSFGNLIGLVSIGMKNCTQKLEYLPSCFLRLPNVDECHFENCPKLGGSFRRILPDNPSEANERSKLKEFRCYNSGLLDEDIQKILLYNPNIEILDVPGNNFVNLQTGIKESNHLTYLDLNDCVELQNIPKCTNLRHLHVNGCTSLAHISELPYTIQTMNASYCFNFSLETSDMLWDQVRNLFIGPKLFSVFNYFMMMNIFSLGLFSLP
jgi:Leucine-rich repeat (LRR) protein